jgi:hypothetical protein
MEEELRNANYEYYSTSGESSGDEDDDLIQSIVASMGMLCSQFKANERNFKMYNREERVNWQDHVTLLLHRNEFEETYRMEHETSMYSSIRSEKISPSTLQKPFRPL